MKQAASDGSLERGVGDPSLDLATAGQIVGLRLLLETGLEYVKSPGPLREVVGPVLLDGAVERAVFIAGNVSGDFKSGRDSMESVFNALIGHRKDSRPQQHILSIRNLHKARNAAQHQGIRCNPEELENWSISVQVLCNWLCAEFLGVDLNQITLASAIEDDHFREQLQSAETALNDGNTEGAVRSARAVMDEAFKAWEVQILGRSRPARGDTYAERRSSQEIEKTLRDLHRGALIAALATNAGESAWFVENWTALKVGREDAGRYVGFVTRWVSAFEATPARSKLYRHNHLARKMRIERTGTEPALVRNVQVVNESPSGVTVIVWIDKVPQSNDYHSWAVGVGEYLRETFDGSATVDSAGALNLRLSEEKLSDLMAAVTDALAAGEEANAKAHEEAKAEEDDLHAFERVYRDVLQALPESIHSVSISGRTGPTSVRLHARTDWPDMVTKELRSALTAVAPGLEVTPSTGGYSLEGDPSPQELQDALRVISNNIVSRQLGADERSREAKARQQRILDTLQAVGFRVVDSSDPADS